MDLPSGRDRLILRDIKAAAGQAVVPSLERHPAPVASYSVANTVPFCGGMMGIRDSSNPWKRRRPKREKQSIHVSCHAIKMEVGVDLSEVRCLDVAPQKAWLGEHDVVHAPTSPSWFKQEVPLCVRLGIPESDRLCCTRRWVEHRHASSVSHADIAAPETSLAFSLRIETRQRCHAHGHMSLERVVRMQRPGIDASIAHAFPLFPLGH